MNARSLSIPVVLATWATLSVATGATVVCLTLTSGPEAPQLHETGPSLGDLASSCGTFIAWALPLFVVGALATLTIRALWSRRAASNGPRDADRD